MRIYKKNLGLRDYLLLFIYLEVLGKLLKVKNLSWMLKIDEKPKYLGLLSEQNVSRYFIIMKEQGKGSSIL